MTDEEDLNKETPIDRTCPSDLYTFLSQQQSAIFDSISFAGEKPKDKAGKDDRIVYDIATNVYCNLSSGKTAPMPAFIEYHSKDNSTEQFLRSGKSFSYSLPPYNILAPSCDLKKDISRGIIEKSIDAVIDGHSLSLLVKSVCLIPDTLGDFKDDIKKQLRNVKGKVVPIPRSIAAAYAFALKTGKTCNLSVYDFDLDVLCVTTVGIVKNEDGELEFVRMSRIKKDLPDCSLSAVLKAYIQEYASNNEVDVSQNTSNLLVETRDILAPIWGRGNVLIQTEESYKTLYCDTYALQTAFKPVFECADKETKKVKESCFLINIGVNSDEFFSLDDLCIGCREIIKRIDEGKTIWKEYLPELSLEVIKDGCFEKLWLVKKDDAYRIQAITESSMQEKIDIPIDRGIFSFQAGVEEVLLPLEREEFGTSKRDKKAKFYGKLFPLSRETEVKFKLSYSFGDPDSYKLTAVGIENPDFRVESEWRDEDAQQDKVVWPEYNANEQAVVSYEECEEVRLMLDAIERKMLAIMSGRQRIGVDRRAPSESNLFAFLNDYCVDKSIYYALSDDTNFKLNYKRNLLKKFTETVNTTEGQGVVRDFLSSEAFGFLADYLIDENSQLRKLAKNYGLQSQVEFSVSGFLSSLGYLYTYVGNARVKELLNIFANYFKSEYIIAASRCISNRQDIMELTAKRIAADIDRKDKNGNSIFVKTLRNISSVCWYNKEWLWNLYYANQSLIGKIEEYLVDYFGQFREKLISSDWVKRDITEFRDVAEVAVALCRLREVDKTIFAPDKESTKKVVEIFKEINNYFKDNKMEIKSRICFKGAGKINRTCYLIISQLSGEGKINLTGFKEE